MSCDAWAWVPALLGASVAQEQRCIPPDAKRNTTSLADVGGTDATRK